MSTTSTPCAPAPPPHHPAPLLLCLLSLALRAAAHPNRPPAVRNACAVRRRYCPIGRSAQRTPCDGVCRAAAGFMCMLSRHQGTAPHGADPYCCEVAVSTCVHHRSRDAVCNGDVLDGAQHAGEDRRVYVGPLRRYRPPLRCTRSHRAISRAAPRLLSGGDGACVLSLHVFAGPRRRCFG